MVSPHPHSARGLAALLHICFRVVVGARKARAWRCGGSEAEVEMWGCGTEITSPVFHRLSPRPHGIPCAASQAARSVGAGSWSFAPEQGAGKEPAGLKAAAGRTLTLSHSPLLSLQLPLMSRLKVVCPGRGKGWMWEGSSAPRRGITAQPRLS